MRKGWVTIFGSATLFALLAVEASAMTGNEFRALPDNLRRMYIVGVIDTWGNLAHVYAPRGGRPKDPTQSAIDAVYGRLFRCVVDRRMTDEQTLAIVDKYLRDTPAHWDLVAPTLIFEAMVEACDWKP